MALNIEIINHQCIFVFRVRFNCSITDAILNVMKKNDTLDELIEIVKNLGRIYDEENLRVNIDFDPNDGMTIVKFQDINTNENTIFINSNNKTVSGIDTTKFWLPDYSNTQKANKRVLRFLEGKGYSSVNITYTKRQRR